MKYSVQISALAVAGLSVLNPLAATAQEAAPVAPATNPLTSPADTGNTAVTSGQSAVPLIKVPEVADAGLADVRNKLAADTPVLSLEEAVLTALHNNPSPQAARAAVDAALARIGIAKSQGGLQVDVNGSLSERRGFIDANNNGNVGLGTTGTNRVLGFNSTASLSLDASLPVYTGGRVKAARRVAESNARAQLASAQQTEQNLAAQTILAYLNVLQNDQLLGVSESNLAVSRERRRVAGVRFDAGAAARLEVLRSDSDLATAQQSRISAANNLAQSKAVLNTLLARAPETPVRVEPIQELDLPTVARFPLAAQAEQIVSGGEIPTGAELRQVALGALPSIRSAEETVNAARYGVDQQRAERRPNLGLSLSGAISNPANTLGKFILNLGLGLAQNIFSSGRISSQIETANATLRQQQFNLASQQLSVGNIIESALLSLDTARKRQASAEVAILAAQEALRSAQLAYTAGAGTNLDVSDAQYALVAAQTNAVNARFDVASAQVQLAAATSQSSTGTSINSSSGVSTVTNNNSSSTTNSNTNTSTNSTTGTTTTSGTTTSR